MAERQLDIVHAFIATFVVVAVLALGVEVFVRLEPRLLGNVVVMGGWEVVVYLGAALGLVRWLRRSSNYRSALGLRPTDPWLLPAAVLAGALAQIPGEALRNLSQWLTPAPEATLAARAALLTAETPTRLIALTLVLGCAVPLTQELVFRGALFGGLQRGRDPRIAAAVAALCSMLTPEIVYSLLPLGFVAVLLSYLRLVSGSVLPSLGFHVAFVCSELTMRATGWASEGEPWPLSWPWKVVGWGALLGLVVVIHGRIHRSPGATAIHREDDA